MGHGASSKQRYKSDPVTVTAPGSSTAKAVETEPEAVSKTLSTSSQSSRAKRFGAKKAQLKIQVDKPGLASALGPRRGSAIRWTQSVASEYTIGEEVMPSTNYGTTVLYAKRLSDGHDVVIKRRCKAKSFSTGEDVHRAWRLSTEYLLNFPKSDHITELYEVLEDHEAYYVVMEKVDGLDLFEALGSPDRPDRAEIQQILKQLLEAVATLHAKGYIHRDLKLENVMLDQTPKSTKTPKSAGWSSKSTRSLNTNKFSFDLRDATEVPKIDEGEVSKLSAGDAKAMASTDPWKSEESEGSEGPLVKIIDFDTVEDYSPKKCSKVVMGTDMYIAQEAYSGHYSPASDVFAIGVIAYKLLTGKFPFTDSIFAEGGDNTVGSPTMRQTQEALKHYVIDWNRPPFNSDKEAVDLCRRMLAPIDTDRPTAKQAQEHPWFSKSEESRGSSHSTVLKSEESSHSTGTGACSP